VTGKAVSQGLEAEAANQMVAVVTYSGEVRQQEDVGEASQEAVRQWRVLGRRHPEFLPQRGIVRFREYLAEADSREQRPHSHSSHGAFLPWEDGCRVMIVISRPDAQIPAHRRRCAQDS
jgi:hypothetical protein